MTAVDLVIVATLPAIACGVMAWGWVRERARLARARARLRDSEKLRADLLRQNVELRERLAAAQPRSATAATPPPQAAAKPPASAASGQGVRRVTQVAIPSGSGAADDDAPAYWEETRPLLPSDSAPAPVGTRPKRQTRRPGT